MKKALMFFIVLLLPNLLFSQKEAYNWCFGANMGFTFDTPDTIPKPFKTSCIAPDATSSISDKNGKLLLYTNGDIVYNGDNDTIGTINTNLYLLKSLKNSHSGATLIIPKPGSDKLYYIFHKKGAHFEIDRSLYYSLIDISANNGKGKIIKKAVPIHGNIRDYKLTATHHANGKDIWLAAHEFNSNGFIIYLITEDGISQPQIYRVGRYFPVLFKDSNGRYFFSKKEQMKFSPDGTKIAMLVYFSSFWHKGSSKGYFELFDFDNSTGVVSNPRAIEIILDSIVYPRNHWYVYFWGLEFSPDSKKIYAFGRQFDISNPSSIESIKNSEYKLYKSEKPILSSGDIEVDLSNGYQLGPDGKIYIPSGHRFLIINNPNEKGISCNFDTTYHDQLSAAETEVYPQFITSWFNFKIKAESHDVCEAEQLELNATDRLNAQYTWTGPKGFTSTEQDPIIPNALPDLTGWYYVTAKRRHDEISSDSVYVKVNPKPDVKIMPRDSVPLCKFGKLVLNTSKQRDDYAYLWSTFETSSSITVDEPGTYYLMVSDSNGCVSEDSVKVYIKDLYPEVEIIGNIPACEGDTLIVKTKKEYAFYNWTTGDTTREIKLTKSTRFSVGVIDSNGCTGTSKELQIIFYLLPKTILKGPDNVCLGSENIYSVYKTQKDTIIWKVTNGTIISGKGTDTITVIWGKTGKGSVIVEQISNNGCIGRDTLEVMIYGANPKIIPPKPVICGDGEIKLQTEKDYLIYNWSTGETTKEISIINSGLYSVQVIDSAGCTGYDTVNVIKADEPTPAITGKTQICLNESTELTLTNNYISYLWNTGDTTQSIIVSKAGNYNVEVVDSNGCRASAGVEVKEILIDLLGTKDIDFGKVDVDNNQEETLILTNNSSQQIEINSIELKNQTTGIRIITTPQTPTILEIGDIITLKVSFAPEQLGNYDDSLIIEVTNPCEKRYSSNIRGIGITRLKVWLPDLTEKVGNRVCIPVQAKFENQNLSFDTDIDYEISYESSAFKPETQFKYTDNNIIINGKKQRFTINKNMDKIIDICGFVLLGKKDTTSLHITKFTLSNPYCEVQIQDGSLTIVGCVLDLSRIKTKIPMEVTLKPNPVDEEIELQLKSSVNGKMTLKIYNLLGHQIDLIQFSKQMTKQTFKFSVKDYPDGIYYFQIMTANYLIANGKFVVGR